MEFYIETNSFAAPWFSDSGHCYVDADSVTTALERCAAEYSHPCGLYAAAAYSSADAKNKGEKPLARWLSNQAEFLSRPEVISFRVDGPGHGVVNREPFALPDPKAGRVYP